jgi:hypothetical protein
VPSTIFKEYVMAKVQGEGDYEAARRFNESEANFVKQGKVQQAAEDAKPKSPAEKRELERAEQEGLSRSKGDDPVDLEVDPDLVDPVEPVGLPPKR